MHMIKDAYSLPRITETCKIVWIGAQWFTSLDLKAGYWQVELDEDSEPLTSLHCGTFRILWMWEYAIWID